MARFQFWQCYCVSKIIKANVVLCVILLWQLLSYLALVIQLHLTVDILTSVASDSFQYWAIVSLSITTLKI